MLVAGIKPGHDGSIAAIRDHRLLHSLESEKDNAPRYSTLTPSTWMSSVELLPEMPDIWALGGWWKQQSSGSTWAGYRGTEEGRLWNAQMFGQSVTCFTSTHERSHIMMALGLAPDLQTEHEVVLVWEGVIGSFYVVNHEGSIVETLPVLDHPGDRYAFLYCLADPTFPPVGARLRPEASGKLMALAAFGDSCDVSEPEVRVIETIMTLSELSPAPKAMFGGSRLFNCGFDTQLFRDAASLLSRRLFEKFASAAEMRLPTGLPLRINGGCGLNCDWNTAWRNHGYFSSVFVPPCTNDSGSAIGTAIDAIRAVEGHRTIPRLDWSVYAGLDFLRDCEPSPSIWHQQDLDVEDLADALLSGDVVAWVQGRWELGPRALGHRSLLADPSKVSTRNRLNWIKGREDYRPIAPCCRVEDLNIAFDSDFEDPYMLYFRNVKSDSLPAVTHIDGTARVQSVSDRDNRPLHALLSRVAARLGVGVLCNTSLNYPGAGLINRFSDLTKFCEDRGIDSMVIDNEWYRQIGAAPYKS